MHHPEPWEVVFSSDVSDRPPTMTWRYPEPRALSAVDLVPLPLSTPVLVNTLNMGEEYQVRVSCSVLLVRKFLACPQIVCYSATLCVVMQHSYEHCVTTQSAAAKLTCDQPFFFFSGKGGKKKNAFLFPSPPNKKGRRTA